MQHWTGTIIYWETTFATTSKPYRERLQMYKVPVPELLFKLFTHVSHVNVLLHKLYVY